jgi:hypothetical protein
MSRRFQYTPGTMQKPEQRAEPRVAVNYSGTLTLNGVSTRCVVQNMCSRGFLIRHSSELPVGQSLHLKCDLYPTRSVECTVQVRHINRQVLGAMVTDMSDEDRRVCLRFLEEQRAIS